MKLFRIEHKTQRVSPMLAKGSEDFELWAWRSFERQLPNWYRDFTLSSNIEAQFPNVKLQDEMYVLPEMKTFCTSKSQLRQWVIRRNTLHNIGFVVVEYEAEDFDVVEGDFQSICHQDKAKRVRTHKITEFFKR